MRLALRAAASASPRRCAAASAAMSSPPAAAPALRVGFLGSGKMAEALALGFAVAGAAPLALMAATDVSAERRAVFSAAGVSSFGSAEEVLARTDLLFVCTKPDGVRPLLRQLAPLLGANHLVVSIAAGVPLAALEAAATAAPSADGAPAPAPRVVRVMPNTPCLVGACAAALAPGSAATPADVAAVLLLFRSVGVCYEVKEALLDAVTGLSGSGPAYAFLVVEALADGGVAAGLPRDVALGLAAQTLAGSAKMVLETGAHPAVLKDQVCSPGGTTIAGVHALEKGGLRAALMDAVAAAAKRSAELAKL